jgi:hypothetical protein
MLTYISHIFENLSNYSKKLDDVTLFQNQKWINIDEIGASKKLFIFRPDNKLLVSIDGKVKKGLWDYIDSSTIILELDEDPILLRHTFIDDEILILNQDSTENYALFIKENEQLKRLNTIEQIKIYLEFKYKGILPPIILPPEIFPPDVIPSKEYTLLNKQDCFDFAWGDYIKYQIRFLFSITTDAYYFGKSSHKYFYVEKGARIYKESLDDIINVLYKEALLRISH